MPRPAGNSVLAKLRRKSVFAATVAAAFLGGAVLRKVITDR
jgi:hypothetical protein